MSLTSSLFTGTSGLRNLGNAMQVIGDNVANVNTVGFKRNRYTFSDVLSQSVATQAGSAQVGRGMALGSIDAAFEQGSFESSGNTTDLSIGGDGFFVVRQPATGRNYYTRAGNFQFDKSGFLVNPEGYVAQGWELDSDSGEEVGSVTDIVLKSFTSPPQATDHLTMITNLDATATSQTEVLPNAWDATNDTPIISANFEYQSVVKIYDSLGSTHDITTYFDKKSDSEWEYLVTCNPAGDKRSLVQDTAGAGLLAKGVITFTENGSIADLTMSQFTGIVGNVQGSLKDSATVNLVNPTNISADGHGFSAVYDGATGTWTLTSPADYPAATAINASSTATRLNISLDGVGTDADMTIDFSETAITGDTVTFDINHPKDASGNLHIQNVENIRYAGPSTTSTPPTLAKDNTKMTINSSDLLTQDLQDITLTWDGTNWTLGGLAGDYTAATASGSADKVAISLDGTSGRSDIVFDFSKSLVATDQLTFDLVGTTAWTKIDSTNTNGYFEFNADFLGGAAGATVMDIEFDIGTQNDGAGSFVNESLSSTQYSRSSSTTFQSGNGYGAGDLQGVDVSSDGVLTGIYSNGQLLPLYRVSLAKFQNNQGLYKEGGNLYRETRESGTAITNKPGENGLGSISPNSLEMSNVDIADEFVKMITTQRGFQANAKIVTTVDTMLGDVIQMKR